MVQGRCGIRGAVGLAMRISHRSGGGRDGGRDGGRGSPYSQVQGVVPPITLLTLGFRPVSVRSEALLTLNGRKTAS